MVKAVFRLASGAFMACALLIGCADKVGTEAASLNDTTPAVASNRNEPVIFNDQRFIVSFEYRHDARAYDVAVRRMSSALKTTAADLKDAGQVGSSTLTHYACPKDTRARALAEPAPQLQKSGTWQGRFECK